MLIQEWMRVHESLAGVIAMAISALMVASFTWLERRFMASN
jgi:hypothetical protein